MLKTILLLFGSVFMFLGCVLFITALVLKNSHKKKEESCTAQTNGSVCGYSMANNNGVHPPIVEYEVNGKRYKKTYSIGLVVNEHGPFTEGQISSISEDKIHIKTNQYVQKDVMRTEFPIGANVPVYYNPNRPEQAFVEMIPKSIVPKVFFIIADVFLAIGIIPLIIFSIV